MAQTKGPESEAYRLEDFLHNASLKTAIRITDNLGLEKRQKRWKCDACGLEVEKIPEFLEGECPKGIQHYFRVIEEEHGEREEPCTAEQADTTETA